MKRRSPVRFSPQPLALGASSTSICPSSPESGVVVSFHSREAGGIPTRKMPSTAAGRVHRGRKNPHHPPRNLPTKKDSSYLIWRYIRLLLLYHPYLHYLLYVIPLEHIKDLVALRNLGFEFPSIKNNDYPNRSLAAWIGRYAWHMRTTDPCINPGPDSMP
ncbi:hypothetical protein Taro_052279, partial [Colocasia esculenta]|nr:hypothetical protein [Colocasia esculenta]